MSQPARQVAAAPDLGSLEAITQAVEGGLGLPEVVRAAARALDASLILIDRSSGVLAVAARSTRRRALADGRRARGRRRTSCGSATQSVGRLRLRGRSGEEPPPALLRVITTLIASEVERLRAPERASEAAQGAFLRAVLRRDVTDRGDLVARGEELGIDLAHGGAVDRRARPPPRAQRRRLARPRARRRRARRPHERARLARRRHRLAGRERRPGRRARPRSGGRGRPPRRRGDRARAPELAARLHLRGRPLARRARPRRPLPRRQRGAAGRQRRRDPPRRHRRPARRCWPSRTPAPTASCSPP